MSDKLAAMREGGAKLRSVKRALATFTKVGIKFEEIEQEAQRLIAAAGATPNFSLVPRYHWATCVMKNDEMCHGIPVGKVVEVGDVIKIDVGLLWHEYNLDTTLTVTFPVEQTAQASHTKKNSNTKGTSNTAEISNTAIENFVQTAQRALTKAIDQAVVGNSIFDISFAMQKIMENAGYGMVYQLTGHGIGKKLHEEPYVPCIAQIADKKRLLSEGQTLAIEVMAAMGNAQLVLDKDGWTYRTKDKSLAVMVEETIAVGKKKPEVLT